jgi:hypothetical protein
MITQAELKELFDYNPETGIFTRKVSRGNTSAGSVAGTEKEYRQSCRYYLIHIGPKHYLAHQLAFMWMTGETPPMVDHINHNGLDNRWSNLRPCSVKENALNKIRYSNNTSGYKGVHFCKKHQKWSAYISKDKKRSHLGYFESAKEAAKAYDTAAKRLFGEYAALNLA